MAKPVDRPRPIFDTEGNSNQLIVAFKYDRPGMVVNIATMASEDSRADFESAVVGAVEKADAVTRRTLHGAQRAHHLTEGMRLNPEHRMSYSSNHPREKLEQYIVLTYPTVEAALAAHAALELHPAVAYVGNNRRIQFSWAPPLGKADPYFMINSTATNAGQYQWGLHAMNFPAAWDVTMGNGYVGAVDSGLDYDKSSPYPSQWHWIVPADLNKNFRSQFSRQDFIDDLYFHGTHVLGIIGAEAANGKGVAGACPTCSVAVYQNYGGVVANAAPGFTYLVEAGMQVINFSSTEVRPSWPEYSCPSSDGFQPLCDAIAFATSRDTLIVAAAGNFSHTGPGFPANQSDVLSVGGAQNNNPGVPGSWSRWTTSIMALEAGYGTPYGSNYAGHDGVMAPAKSIVSVVPVGIDPRTKKQIPITYNATPPFDCTDKLWPLNSGYLADGSGNEMDGYATCTGTSMAAPHVSALAGILRSINPRLSKDMIKGIIRQTSSAVFFPTVTQGYGMPNAKSAVNNTVARTPNHLTPLFSFFSNSRKDYFYTTVPQMATAALFGTLLPRLSSPDATHTASTARYDSNGDATAVTGYSFPGHSAVPRADAWVFTTNTNPKNAAIPLVPLYRLSRKCADLSNPPAVCSAYPEHIDVTYTADSAGVTAFQNIGYKLDGIEGYIYPATMSPQPLGTKKLMRKYNPTLDDHAIFPENILATMQSRGYTQNSGADWFGYVYPNLTGEAPAIQ